MAYKPKVLTVPEGGTGLATLTNHGVLVGASTSNITQLAAGIGGQVLQSGGASADPAYSTPTYPSTSGTSRKIIVSNGTNNVYSTETWAVPGTSGNVLTSDGTNWTSAAAAGAGLGYVLFMITGVGNPADATTYFMQLTTALTTSTASGPSVQKLYIPKAGTITAAYGSVRVVGTLGSNENTTVALRQNNTTDINITTTLQLTGAANDFNNSSLATSVSAGDYLEIKLICPTWATNPVTVSLAVSIYIS